VADLQRRRRPAQGRNTQVGEGLGNVSVAIGQGADYAEYCGHEKQLLKRDEPTDEQGMLNFAVFHECVPFACWRASSLCPRRPVGSPFVTARRSCGPIIDQNLIDAQV